MAIKFDSILGELRVSDAGISNTTASNIGTDGVGIFKQKTADNLEFYNLVGDTGSLISVEAPDINGNIVLTPNPSAIFNAGISGNEFDINHNGLGGLQGGTLAEYYHLTAAQHTIVGNTSGTNTGDNATNTQYSGLVTNATHTGDATGSGALTVVALNGTNLAGLATGVLKNTTTTGVPFISKVVLTEPATTATLTIADNQTLTVNGSATITNGTHSGTNTGDNTNFAPPLGADDNYVTDAQLAALHPAVTIGTNTASALSLSTQALSIGDVFVQNTGDTIAGDLSINAGYRLGVGVAVSTLADIRINSTATNESSLYAGIWQSVSFNPVGTPVAGTSVRGLLFQVSTPAVADDLSNVILYGALGQVTHGGSGALSQAIGMNPGIFLTGSGNVTTSAGITVSATSSGGGLHGTWFGIRSGGITLSGGSTMTTSYAFYADAVTGATTNYAFYSNGGLVHFGDNVDLTSGKTLTMPVGSIITDTTTGLKIGTATTQKIGFFNVTPVVQPSAYTQTYTTAAKTVPAATAATLTDSTGGTADTTLAAVEATYTQATVRNNFADLAAMVNKLTADDLAIKKVINSLVDDLQALGLIS